MSSKIKRSRNHRPMHEQHYQAARLAANGVKKAAIAKKLGVDTSTVYTWFYRADFRREVEKQSEEATKDLRRRMSGIREEALAIGLRALHEGMRVLEREDASMSDATSLAREAREWVRFTGAHSGLHEVKRAEVTLDVEERLVEDLRRQLDGRSPEEIGEVLRIVENG